MSKPKVLVSRVTPGLEESELYRACDVWAWPEDRVVPKALFMEHLPDVEGLYVTPWDPITREVLDAAPRLRVLSQYAVGLDNLDLKALNARGIPVGYTPGVVTEATADMAMALLLSLSRRIVDGANFVKAGRWKAPSPLLMLSNDVHEKTLGIIGMGRIGQAIARRAAGFRMKLLYHARHARPEAERELGVQHRPLDALLAESDIVITIVPLTPETRYLINDAAFGKMKRSALLINVARGPVVDPKALYRALSSHRIQGAALDVTDPEPIPADDPLMTLDNLMIVPHISTSTVETRRKMTDIAVTNLLNGLAGKPLLHCANPEVQANPEALKKG